MKIIYIIAFIFSGYLALCQELNCKVVVNINKQNVSISDASIFKSMENDFANFLNNKKWTNDNFETEEKINCNLILTITSVPNVGNYTASVQIVSARPVYGTEYETVLLNFSDQDWSFVYIPSKPIQYNQNMYLDDISSLLAFYANIIIGLDYDSFSPLGGTPYFQEAQQIVNNAQQQSSINGWQQFGNILSRFWLSENLLNTRLEPMRLASYEYHRLGLDIMNEKPDDAKKIILNSLKKIHEANNALARSTLLLSFIEAKTIELKQIYSSGDLNIRKKVYEILTQLDPNSTEQFKVILE